MMRLGADQVKEVKAQKLLQDFENITFKEGESSDDFGMRITNLAADTIFVGGDHGGSMRRQEIFVRHFSPIAVFIEMSCNTKNMTVEELVGCLQAAEECLDNTIERITDKAGHLMLAEEEWLE